MTAIHELVDTVVLVMMENRSFDHMLGHLSYEGLNPDVRGLVKPLNQYFNLYKGDKYPPWRRTRDHQLEADLPHEYDHIDEQLARSSASGYTMRGFVESYAKTTGVEPSPKAPPMGFFGSSHVPITSFLAQQFAVCDHWFAPLPSSTQPNRTMAFCGESPIHRTAGKPILAGELLFEWCSRHNVPWRVYHDGLSFFALYPRAVPEVLGSRFRDWEELFKDLSTPPVTGDPRLVIVEPSYQDAPHVGPDRPNDNHAPLAIGWGEEFLRRTYQAVSSNADRWARTVMILYYDEHGGFWDHVPPPLIPYDTTSSPAFRFKSLGPRIPAIIISPLVDPNTVFQGILDHTSVLQLVAEVFTPGSEYSTAVGTRARSGIQSVSECLARGTPRADIPRAPTTPIEVRSVLGRSLAQAPQSEMQVAFEGSARLLVRDHPAETDLKYPELRLWIAAADAGRDQVNDRPT